MEFNEWKELRIASKNSFEDKNSRELSSLLSLRHVGCFSFSFSWRLCHLYTSSNIFWSKIESNDYTVDYAIVNILCSYSSHKYFIITMYFYSYRYTANEEEIWCEWVCNMIEGLACPVLDDRYWILNLVRRQSKRGRERKDEDEDILFEHAVGISLFGKTKNIFTDIKSWAWFTILEPMHLDFLVHDVPKVALSSPILG